MEENEFVSTTSTTSTPTTTTTTTTRYPYKRDIIIAEREYARTRKIVDSHEEPHFWSYFITVILAIALVIMFAFGLYLLLK